MGNYLILLYYCYTQIENVEKFREEHHLYCIQHNIRGRVIISPEGINGTVSGRRSDCEKYMADLKADQRFAKTDFKIESYNKHAFEKIHVRIKDEIVNSGLKDINPNERTGIHLEPSEFKKIKDNEDIVILDVRSNYEHNIGKFKNAITLDMENFREFPEKINEIGHLKEKKIITYCTGGIKCEKASAYLLEKGFKNVYQLHGGIIKYGIEEGGKDFEGKCYVFDNRIAVDINKINPEVISVCYVCGTKCDRMVNCANPECNNHIPLCESCARELDGACSETCRKHPRKRPYNGKGYYPKQTNGYNPYIGLKRKAFDK